MLRNSESHTRVLQDAVTDGSGQTIFGVVLGGHDGRKDSSQPLRVQDDAEMRQGMKKWGWSKVWGEGKEDSRGRFVRVVEPRFRSIKINYRAKIVKEFRGKLDSIFSAYSTTFHRELLPLSPAVDWHRKLK